MIQKLLTDLCERGITLLLEGDGRLQVEAARGILTESDRATLTAHKQEIIELLRDSRSAQTNSPPERDTLADSDLSAVLLHSRIVGEEIWLVRDSDAINDIANEIAGRAVLLFAEVERLRGKSPEELKAIVKVKRVFGPMTRVLQ